MQPLSKDGLRELRAARQEIGLGLHLSQSDLDTLRSQWEPRAEPDEKDNSEQFAVVRPDGTETGAIGPRWLFHLFGLCHRASHVGFATSAGLVIIQRRSPTKTDWPDAWDMAVAGHVPYELSYEEGAFKEIEEELGLPSWDLPGLLMEGALQRVGEPYFAFDQDEQRNPPFYNAEARQIFAATLTPEGLAHIKPDHEELSGIYLCPPEEAWDILAREPVASGLRYSLPRYLHWLMVDS